MYISTSNKVQCATSVEARFFSSSFYPFASTLGSTPQAFFIHSHVQIHAEVMLEVMLSCLLCSMSEWHLEARLVRKASSSN